MRANQTHFIILLNCSRFYRLQNAYNAHEKSRITWFAVCNNVNKMVYEYSNEWEMTDDGNNRNVIINTSWKLSGIRARFWSVLYYVRRIGLSFIQFLKRYNLTIKFRASARNHQRITRKKKENNAHTYQCHTRSQTLLRV